MNSGATAERVFEALRRQIMNRAFRPGDRLEPAALADGLASSVTPVRDALHLLTGQGLVTARAGEGFYVPSLDEPALSDLYAWTCEILVAATRAWSQDGVREASDLTSVRAPQDEPWADRTADLFEEIAARSANAEHRHAAAAVNARLHPVRLVEPSVLDGIEPELEAIRGALRMADGRALRSLLAAYHRRRRRRSAAIVRAVYRAG